MGIGYSRECVCGDRAQMGKESNRATIPSRSPASSWEVLGWVLNAYWRQVPRPSADYKVQKLNVHHVHGMTREIDRNQQSQRHINLEKCKRKTQTNFLVT
jgi:hypothetical protein